MRCPTHGAVPDTSECPICDIPERNSIREMCRRTLVEWVESWPDPQGWRHEVAWRNDGILILSQQAGDDRIWSCIKVITRWELEHGPADLVRWMAIESWRELHKTADQQGD